MTPEEQTKLNRMEHLGEILKEYMNTEPRITPSEVAFVIAEEIEDLTLFLKEYKKELKK